MHAFLQLTCPRCGTTLLDSFVSLPQGQRLFWPASTASHSAPQSIFMQPSILLSASVCVPPNIYRGFGRRDLAILAAYTVAAFWGVGIETIRLIGELPHGLSH